MDLEFFLLPALARQLQYESPHESYIEHDPACAIRTSEARIEYTPHYAQVEIAVFGCLDWTSLLSP